MNARSLFKTNPHLQNQKKYHKALITSVATSTSIETDEPAESIAQTLVEMEKENSIKTTKDSS